MNKYLLILLISVMFVQCNNSQNTKNNFQVKIDSLKVVLSGNPNDSTAILELGQNLQFNGQIKEAIELLKDAKSKFPNNAKIAIWHANSESIMAGASEDIKDKVRWSQYALADLDETVQKFNSDWYVHYIRGINSVNWPDMFQRKPVAIEDFEFLLTFDKNNPNKINPEYFENIHFFLGFAYYKTNQGSIKYLPHFEYVKKNFPNSQFIVKINEINNNSTSKEKQ